MTEEQKLEALQRLLQGANVAQVNLGDGTQNFYVGHDEKCQQEPAAPADVEEAEEVGEADAPSLGKTEKTEEHDLCIPLNLHQRQILKAAEAEGIIRYNDARRGYDKGDQSSQALVAYLCGRLFCGDSTDKDGHWRAGSRFEEAQYCKELFGFDVAATRRSTKANASCKSPIGYHRVDGLFK